MVEISQGSVFGRWEKSAFGNVGKYIEKYVETWKIYGNICGKYMVRIPFKVSLVIKHGLPEGMCHDQNIIYGLWVIHPICLIYKHHQ
jgi:hypothetical protein